MFLKSLRTKSLIILTVNTLSSIAFANQENMILVFRDGNIVNGINISEVDYIQIEPSATRTEERPCLIFYNSENTDYSVDLIKYNRITFGEETMTLTNSQNSENPIELLYSAYNRFKVSDAIPSVTIYDVVKESSAKLIYLQSEQLLTILADKSLDMFNVGVFNLNGYLVLQAELHPNESISVESLNPGAYVAISVGNKCNQSIKFIK